MCLGHCGAECTAAQLTLITSESVGCVVVSFVVELVSGVSSLRLCDQHPYVCVEADDDSSKAMDELYYTVSKCKWI